MDALASDDVFLFEDFRLHRRGGGLFRRDKHGAFVPVAIGSRALDVLAALFERPGDLVSRDEISAAVWPATVVEDNNLNMQIAALRRVLDDRRAAGSCIQTVAGRGYRFVTAVRRVAAQTRADPMAPQVETRPRLSIVVLPFTNLSDDANQQYFADGMAEEIITALSRVRQIFVIARNSTFSYKGQAPDISGVGRELGVRYVLEGSVRKAGNRVRITAQLIEVETGTHLWADRFDGSLGDVFELQDQVAISVAGVIEPTLEAAEIRRSARRPMTDLTAYDLYLRALPHANRYAKDDALRAVALFDRVLERDPHHVPALVRASLCHMQLYNGGWTDDPEQVKRTGIDLARRAIAADNGDPDVLSGAAHALGFFDGDLSVSMRMISHSLSLNPSAAESWGAGGWNRIWAGEPDAAIRHFEAALHLSPREPRRQSWLTGIGAAYFISARFDEAVGMLLPAIAEHPSYPTPYRFLAACYAHLGRIEEARDILNRLRAVSSNLLALQNLRKPENQELLRSGLLIAAGEPG